MYKLHGFFSDLGQNRMSWPITFNTDFDYSNASDKYKYTAKRFVGHFDYAKVINSVTTAQNIHT